VAHVQCTNGTRGDWCDDWAFHDEVLSYWIQKEGEDGFSPTYYIKVGLAAMLPAYFCTYLLDTERGFIVEISEDILLVQVIPLLQEYMIRDLVLSSWIGYSDTLEKGGMFQFFRRKHGSRMGPSYLLYNAIKQFDEKRYSWNDYHQSTISCVKSVQILGHRYPPVVLAEELIFTQNQRVLKRSRERTGISIDTSVSIASRIPDIESLTSYLPPCLRIPVVNARGPDGHLGNSDRMVFGFYLKAMGYDSETARKYIRATASIYSNGRTTKSPLEDSFGCTGLITHVQEKKRNGSVCVTHCHHVNVDGKPNY